MSIPVTSTKVSDASTAGGDAPKKGITISSLQDIQAVITKLLYNNQNDSVKQAFEQFEQKTKVKREHLAYVLIGIASLYMIFGAFARLLCNFIGFAYPAYASVKAIRTSEKDDDTHWLVYWTVFAAFSLIDFFAEIVFAYFPIYWVAKAGFMLYLYLPQTYGALVLYDRALDPAITKFDELMKSYCAEGAKKK